MSFLFNKLFKQWVNHAVVKQSSKSKKSRRFHGNRYAKNLLNNSALLLAPFIGTENESLSSNTSLNLFISLKKKSKKLRHHKSVGYRFVDIEIL